MSETPTPQELSPLKEADPLSLEDLFNMDPMNLQEQHLDQTVKYLRLARETFLKEQAAGPKKGDTKAPKALAGPKVALDKTMTADDLDL